MSLQLVIARRVALQQSSPPLHQPSAILKGKRKNEKEKPLNRMCANSKLSQQRGSPHASAPGVVPISAGRAEKIEMLIQKGIERLATTLPFEAPPERQVDSALLFLLHP